MVSAKMKGKRRDRQDGWCTEMQEKKSSDLERSDLRSPASEEAL